MAELIKQRRIVKKLSNFYKNTGYSSPQTYQYRLTNISSGVPEGDFLQSLQTKATIKDELLYIFRKKYYESPKYQLDRMHKTRALYDSCRKDGFIIPVLSSDPNKTFHGKPIETGIVESESGKDLLHFFGFTEILLKKYSLLKLIVFTALTTILSITVLGWIIIHIIIPFLLSLF